MFTPFIPLRSHYVAPPRVIAVLASALSFGCRPSFFGSDCLRHSLRSHRTLTSDYHCRYCRVCFVLSVDYRPSYFGSGNRLRSLHAHRIALLALIPLAGWRLTHPSFRQSSGPLHSLTSPFLCSFSLTQSLCSLMLRSSTLSFTSFTQLSYFNGKCFVMFVRFLCAVVKSSFFSPSTFLTHSAIAFNSCH